VPSWRECGKALFKFDSLARVEKFAGDGQMNANRGTQAPELLEFVMGQFYAKVFFGGTVEQRYKQLARLKLSLIHGCLTCNKQNVPGALAAGFTQAQIDALIDGDSAAFAPSERAVIEYAEQIALSNMYGKMSPELFARLRANFSEAQILELGTAMAVISGMAKLSFVLGLVERESYCPFAAADAGRADAGRADSAAA